MTTLKQDDIVLNTKHIKELADQIKNNDDCESLKEFVKTYLDNQIAHLEAIIKAQLKLIEDIFPILKFPKNLKEVIDWIGHLILGTAYEQLKAFVNYTISLIKLAAAIAELAEAIAEVGPRIAACAIELEQTALAEVKGKLDFMVNEALSKVQEAQDKLTNVVGQIDAGIQTVQYATHDPVAFIQSVTENSIALDKQISDIKSSGASMTQPDTVSTVNQNVTALDGSILSITNGLVTKVTPP